jgi:hypothetical protein
MALCAQAAVEPHLGQVEPDDAVERGERLRHAAARTHTSRNPLVASRSQRRVRHLMTEGRFDLDPQRPRRQSDQQTPQTHSHPTRAAGDTRMGRRSLQQRLGCGQHRVLHIGLERAHDVVGDLPGRRFVGSHSASQPSQPADRRDGHHLSARVLTTPDPRWASSVGRELQAEPSDSKRPEEPKRAGAHAKAPALFVWRLSRLRDC